MNDTPAAEHELVDLIVQCEQALDATEGAHGARAPGSGRVSPWSCLRACSFPILH